MNGYSTASLFFIVHVTNLYKIHDLYNAMVKVTGPKGLLYIVP